MLKPVSILALDEPSASLAAAVASRIKASSGLEDLVQFRAIERDAIAPALSSIHALRQAPNSPLRTRDDISARELVLVIASATSKEAVDVARQIRRLYDMRRLADLYSIELLVLLPDLFADATEEDYGAAYSLLKRTAFEKAFDAVWLLDSMNANRVKFGPLAGTEAYADALAGALTFEAELSGAIPGAFRPRGMEAAFSSFGYAELYFPREAALARLEPRFAAELLRGRLLDGAAAAHPMMEAKQFVLADTFAAPLARIGVEAGQSLFKRFQPKTLVDEKTRGADEVIAAVRTELAAYRGGTHAKNLQSLAAQGDQTATEFASLLTRAVDETLDRDGYPSCAPTPTSRRGISSPRSTPPPRRSTSGCASSRITPPATRHGGASASSTTCCRIRSSSPTCSIRSRHPSHWQRWRRSSGRCAHACPSCCSPRRRRTTPRATPRGRRRACGLPRRRRRRRSSCASCSRNVRASRRRWRRRWRRGGCTSGRSASGPWRGCWSWWPRGIPSRCRRNGAATTRS